MLVLGVFVLVSLGLQVAGGTAAAQSCTTPSCPSDAFCSSFGCDESLGTQDPICHVSQADTCKYPDDPNGCPQGRQSDGGDCCYFVTSPILVDLTGEGFRLTDIARGVPFQILPGPENLDKIAWTAPDAQNAWLALDRNGNRRIDDFSELFGNLTAQPQPPSGQQRNGFAALAVFDKAANGGNEDGWISDQDAVYEHLRLWRDRNHNGRSEKGELLPLPEAGVKAISLNYSILRNVDRFGNHFRYRAIIRDTNDGETGPVAYDVFLASQAIDFKKSSEIEGGVQ